MAIAMVAASQHGACPALRACAFALLENSAIDDVVEGAECLGARAQELQQDPVAEFNLSGGGVLPSTHKGAPQLRRAKRGKMD